MIAILILRYVAGVVSGIAMIAAFIFLKESNPLIVDEEGNPRKKKLERTVYSVYIKNRKRKTNKTKEDSASCQSSNGNVFCI